ncbi:MAG: CotH kinase family protein [Spirochaeta sp.]
MQNPLTGIQKSLIVALLLMILLVTVYTAALFYAEEPSFEDANLARVIRTYMPEDTNFSYSELARITEIDAPHAGIQDLKGIEQLPNLRIINLSGNPLNSLQPLQSLDQLEELQLREIGMDSVSDLGMASLGRNRMLRRLILDNNPDLEDISALAELPQLREISLRSTAVHDIAPLKELTQLQELNLRDSDVLDISPLAQLYNLEYLNLHSNSGIGSIEPLRELTELHTLILRNVRIEDQIDVLSTLHNLRKVNLRNTGIQDLSPLVKLMQQGTLQDDPNGRFIAEVDIRDNPVSGNPNDGPIGYDILLPYWHNITNRKPEELPRRPSREIHINEIMSSNATVLADAHGEHHDWIELYNPGSETLDISGFFLSRDPEDPHQWQVPQGIMLKAGEFLLIYASGKDEQTENGELHSGFTLPSDGGRLSVTAADGVRLVDEMHYPAIPRDTSRGLYDSDSSDSASLATFITPSPGKPNTEGRIYIPVDFSHTGGYYREAFELTLQTADPGISIYYTLDGSVPDPVSNQDATILYRDPIPIYNRTQERNRVADIPTTVPAADFWDWQEPQGDVFKGTVIRAAAWSDGLRSSINSNSYFVHEDINTLFPLAVFSILADPEDLFSSERGIYVPGRLYEEAEERFDGHWMEHPANYLEKREIPVHIEFYEPDGYRGFSQPAGIRIHGGWSRSSPLKSLRLYARKDYDRRNTFAYPVFPGATQRYNHTAIQEYRRLMLRSGQSLFRSHLQDAITQEHVRPYTSVDLMRYRPVIHFINGEYWGLKNLRERFDQYYLQNNYGVDPQNLVILEGPMGYPSQLKWGEEEDGRSYRELLRYVETNDMSADRHYDHVRSVMDIDSFIDYNIIRIYSGDPDGVTKHIAVWRVLDTAELDPDIPLDERWRWHTWDLDNSLLFVENNTMNFYANDGVPQQARETRSTILEQSTTNERTSNPVYTTLIAGLMQNHDFRVRFINRFADLLNTLYHPDIYAAAIQQAGAVIEPEMQRHINRWHYPATYQYWQDQVEQSVAFARARPEIQIEHILDYFQLRDIQIGDPVKVHIEIPETGGSVRINSLQLDGEMPGTSPRSGDPPVWQGQYFAGIPVELEVRPSPGFEFTGWEGDVQSDQLHKAHISINPEQEITVSPRFSRQSNTTD